MPAVRGARADKLGRVRAIMANAFKTEDEAQLFDHLLAHDPGCIPDNIRVAVHGDEPVACTVVLPRRFYTRLGLTPGAIITLVACLPEYQGQGYGGATVQDALQHAKHLGLSFAVLYGHPGYYPRFGFVPVLPHYETTVELPAGEAEPLVATADYALLTGLYRAAYSGYPLASEREPVAWHWEPRKPEEYSPLTLQDHSAYAFVSADKVHEAAATDRKSAERLLRALAQRARQLGHEKLRLFLPPDHLLSRLALLHKAEYRYVTAAAGMAVVLDWEPLLPPGYDQQIAQPLLTQLVFGYRSAADVGQAEAFPPVNPKWSLEPLWY